jgi:CheY-like chemotaxis protein
LEVVAVKRILLVEDNRAVRVVLEHMLLSAGYSVEGTDTVARARSRLGFAVFDLVIADGMLSDGTGFEVADLATSCGMKALIITGRAGSFKHGQLDRHPYLLKPMRPPELEHAVARMIGPAEIAD